MPLLFSHRLLEFGLSPLLLIMNNAAINAHVQVFVGVFSIFLGIYLGIYIELPGNSMLTF